jgi:hypothetical protein
VYVTKEVLNIYNISAMPQPLTWEYPEALFISHVGLDHYAGRFWFTWKLAPI